MAPAEPSRRVIRATLGGLVHDLGKPWSQVPGRPPEATRFDCETPRDHTSLEGCPSCKHYRSAHAPLGATLLRDALGGSFSFLQELALGHHGNPSVVERGGDLLRYVILGDHLSAGERDDRYDEASEPVPLLRNPFAQEDDVRAAPVPLAQPDLLLLPPPAGGDVGRQIDGLVAWQRAALGQAAAYAGDDERWLVDHLSGAVEASAGVVPSAFWRTVADVSLASHLQLAGAFAGALAAAGLPADLDLDSYQEPVAVLVLGDLSGIQAFLHRVAGRRAARSLRARSFYLSVLSLVLARALAERLGVTSANVLSSVGGNFLVLGPAGCEAKLPAVAAELDAALAEAHGAALSVSLAAVPVRPADVSDFSPLVTELRRRLQDAKARRAEHTALALGIFEPREGGGPLRACRSCGADAAAGRQEEDERICPFCASLEELGRVLPRSQFLTVEPAGDGAIQGWEGAARTLGYRLRLHEEPPGPPLAGAVYALSQAAMDRVRCARLLPSGRYVPSEGGEVVDFRELARRARGRPLLAVLKADVDDLGRTFATHFQRDRRSVQSPSRVATFMRLLSLFFEGRVNHLAEQEFRDLYVVFAGGDDLAVVGPWDVVLEFALRLREEFRVWTGKNPGFHFSAGVALGAPDRPMVAALQEAEQRLGQAKDRPGKDAVGILDGVLPWPHLEEMLAWYETLVGLVEGAGGAVGVARALLQRLKRLHVLTEPKDGRLRYGPELWRAYYALRRFAERHQAASRALDAMYEHALEDYGGLKLAMAARLAEFATTRAEGGSHP